MRYLDRCMACGAAAGPERVLGTYLTPRGVFIRVCAPCAALDGKLRPVTV